MNIFLVHYYSSKPTPCYDEIAQKLRDQGHNVWIGNRAINSSMEWSDGITIIDSQKGPKRIIGSKLPFIGKIINALVFFGFTLRLRKFIRVNNPDIVQVNPFSNTWMLPLFMPQNIKFIQDIRQLGLGGKGTIKGRLHDWFTLKKIFISSRFIYDKTFFCDSAVANLVFGNTWEKWGVVLPVGVDKTFFLINRKLKRQKNDNLVRFIYIGTLSKVRNLDTILQAIEKLKKKTDIFKVVFLGPDESGNHYNKLISDFNLGGFVEIKPPISYCKVPDMLSNFDVAIAYVPSRPDWQYQPTLKVLEYRAVGIPILASDNPPNRRIVEEGVNGFLVGDSPDEWAEAMFRCISDKLLLEHLKKNATEMRGGRTWEDIGHMHDESYNLIKEEV